jgi:hypothetical protein
MRQQGQEKRHELELDRRARLARRLSRPLAGLLATLADAAGSVPAQWLTGWARLPAATFADGSTSGQFAAPNPSGTQVPPYPSRQPAQGFLGHAAQGNSADALLHAYAVQIAWRIARGGRREPASDATEFVRIRQPVSLVARGLEDEHRPGDGRRADDDED